MKITIIGSKTQPDFIEAASGSFIKVALFEKVLKHEGFSVNFINLIRWKRNFLPIVFKIAKAIKSGDTILIMGGPSGSRILISLCLFFNKKQKSKLIYPMIGTGVIRNKYEKLSMNFRNDFLTNGGGFGIKDKRMAKKLKKLDLILAQNEGIVDFYKNFYELTNVEKILNFRVVESRPGINRTFNVNKKIIFFARVCSEKGIFDLLKAVNDINGSNVKCSLDIYGKLQLSEKEYLHFHSFLNDSVKYKGVVKNDNAIEIINDYDFLVLPTKYGGEGTPGTIIESFLANVPVLSSDFPNAKTIISNNKNGILFNFNDFDSLKLKLLSIVNMSEQEINKFKLEAHKAGNAYDYSYYRETFLEFFGRK